MDPSLLSHDLAQSAARALHESDDAIVLQGTDGRILWWNHGATRMYGWSESEALTSDSCFAVPEEEHRSHRATLRRVIHGETVPPFVARRLTQGGRVLDVWVTLTPLCDEADRVFAVAAAEWEVKDQNSEVKELRQHERNLRALVESAPDAMILVDQRGTINMVNRQAKHLFGYAPEALLGQPIEMLLPKRLRAAHRAHRRQYAREPRFREMGMGLDLLGRTRDGKELPIEVSLSPIGSGAEQKVCASIRDATQRMEAQKVIQQAKEQAERANAAKTRFLATASHDLRQPLQSLSLLNAALLKIVDQPDVRRIVLLQQASIGGMMRLLGKLLDISKLESGMVEPKIQSVPMTGILELLRAEFGPLAADRELEFRLKPCNQVVQSDPELLAQLLQNLVANAIRYTEIGYVQIGCRREGDSLQVIVEDSGVGVPPEELDAIFDEFYQVPRDSTRHRGGLGLGLAIVRRLATLLELRIEVDSEPGKGSRFSVTMPVSEVREQQSARNSDNPDPGKSLAGRILVVDDDAAVLEAAAIFLSFVEDLEVITASTPGEARALLEEFTPDIIVTDLHLGNDESGINLIAAARKRTGRAIAAILLTGDTSFSVDTMGIDDLVVCHKPIDPEEFLSGMRQLLESRVS